ncbi:putative MatE family transporter [Kineosphaera limosa NBRC 100340]|uniref:Putative MatE family transporter n=1 Tax=Kineosphaera limosa NBRC 100340 TaxID=1184609 RepID=K6XEH7_9MICO|nr:MATE family efflux transporter [Kineosphaera limosa]GAB97224.1 putative MatE family transporter [Kineosphaera limosa NBRC 100340]
MLRLAIPAFLALVAEPLFLLADAAIVGHLGTPQLAGLGAASAALTTMASIYIFLAYGTTSLVARRLGAGDLRGALGAGLDGIWLAVILGLTSAVLVAVFAQPICEVFGVSPEATQHAVTYLRISTISLPAMLIVLATTGVLRGLQDTRTPLIASVAAFGTNVVLNYVFVYGFHMGIAGSAWGTVIAQTGMSAALLIVVLRAARRHQAPMRFRPGRVLSAAATGVPLLVRTLALRAAILATTFVAARLGDVPLAAYQVAATIWTFLAFALDALAIAAQALTGRALGAGDVPAVRDATGLMVRWGIGFGVVLGLLVAALSPVLPRLFTSDPAVQAALTAGLLVIGLTVPISGHAFVLDGVLIGAGDGTHLAVLQLIALVAYLPVLAVVFLAGEHLMAQGAPLAIAAVWAAMAWFMLLRSLLLHRRARTDKWLITGV